MLWTFLSWFFPTKQKGGAMYLRDRILYDFHGRCFGVRPKSRLRDIICCARTSRTCISTFALSVMFFCSFFLKKMPPFNSYISCNPPLLLFRLQVWWGFLQRVDCCNCRSKRKLAVNHHVRTKKKCTRSNVSGQCIGSYSSTLRFRSFPFQCVFLLFHLNVGLRVALICVMIPLHAAAVSPSCYHHKGT